MAGVALLRLPLLCVAASALLGRDVGAAQVAARLRGKASKNPIEKVIDLLRAMTKKVQSEGDKEKDLFEKYQCFCTTGMANLKQNIAGDEVKLPQLRGGLEAKEGAVTSLAQEMQRLKRDIADTKAKMSEAQSLRSKEAIAFEKSSAEYKANINAINKAVTALSAGGGAQATFLQGESTAVGLLRNLAGSEGMTVERQEALAQVLSEDRDSDTRSSGEVVGILKQLKSTMDEGLKEMVVEEKQRVAGFKALMASSQKEVDASVASFEKKQVRHGVLQVDVVNMKDDLETTTKAYTSNKEFMIHLQGMCKTIGQTYAEHMAMRSEELITLAETIKILGSDSSRDMFRTRKKRTGAQAAAASFLQTGASMQVRSRRQQASRIIHAAIANAKASGRDTKLDLLLLALRGKKIGFANVEKIIKDRIGILRKEQTEDDNKRDYCIKEAADNQRAMNDVQTKISDLRKSIQEAQETLKTYDAEIEALTGAIKRQDDATAEATQRRKDNHEAFVEEIASNKAAIEVLQLAKDRLLQYYNPKLAKSKDDDDDNEDEEPDVNPNQFGPGAMAMMKGMTGLAQQAPPEQPPAKYKRSSEGSQGVLDLLQQLESEVRRDTQESEIEEKNHQNSYEVAMKDANDKRVILVQTLMEKQSAKANIAKEIHSLRSTSGKAAKQMEELVKYVSILKGDCDFLVKHYTARRSLRASEKDSLRSAADVLAGASS
mmetsp:Transcript_124578/g.360275  ORF Transcript_124578/g.360275 Transcript_124578/m.360275 type:complete len:716 (-) Transcript_124578:60-2207(-)